MSEHNYTPAHIANYFLQKAEKEDINISPMKLLKLVYIGYGWVIALTNEKLFGEPIQAWQHGPVVPSLYNEFKSYGKYPIDTLATELDLDKGTVSTPKISKEHDNIRAILGKVWGVYKDFSAWSLRNKTHEEGTPWDQTYRASGAFSDIDPELIKTHFHNKIEEYIGAGKRERETA